MISKQLIRTLGLLLMIGSGLYSLYGLFILGISRFPEEGISENLLLLMNAWVYGLQLVSIVLVLFGITGIYYLLSATLKTPGLVAAILVFFGFVLVSGQVFMQAFLMVPEKLFSLITNISSKVMVVGWTLAIFGFILYGFLLRKHKLFSRSITTSIMIGSAVNIGVFFTKESALLIELVSMAFLFLLGLMPLGFQIFNMYRNEHTKDESI